jgi:hypothetical protein
VQRAPRWLPDPLLVQGAGVRTGRDGYVTPELADCSELAIGPDTNLRIDAHWRYQKTAAFESAPRLLKGAADALLSPACGQGAVGRQTRTSARQMPTHGLVQRCPIGARSH